MKLREAIREGDIEAVQQHLVAGADVNAKDDNGWNPLHLAAENGRKQVAELLIANGADVNAKDNNGWTPLFYAAAKTGSGHKEIVELLIANDADVNALSVYGAPLDEAVERDEGEIADLLRKHGGKTGEELKATGN